MPIRPPRRLRQARLARIGSDRVTALHTDELIFHRLAAAEDDFAALGSLERFRRRIAEENWHRLGDCSAVRAYRHSRSPTPIRRCVANARATAALAP